MAGAENGLSTTDLQQRRAAILRGFARANHGALIVVLAVLALAVLALAAAFKAERNARLALAATQSAQTELWKARLAQARAERLSGAVGSRAQGVAAVAAAAKIQATLELREEAIGLLAQPDLAEQPIFWPHATNLVESSLDFDAALRRFSWGDRNGLTRIHRLDDNRELARLPGPNARVETTLFSPDGTRLAARYRNGEFRLWSLADQRQVVGRFCPSIQEQGWSMAFTADSRVVAAGDTTNRVLRLFDTASGTELNPLPIPEPFHFEFSPGGPWLAEAGGDYLRIWNWQSRQMLEQVPGGPFSGLLAWSQDGQRLACSQGNQNILLWDRQHGTTNLLVGHSAYISDLMFDPRDAFLASRSWDGTTRLWDSVSGRSLRTAHRGYAMRFSQDGQRLAYLRERAGVGWWQVLHGDVLRSLTPVSAASSFLSGPEFSPDGRWLALCARDGLHLRELPAGREVKHVSFPIDDSPTLFFRSDGSALFLATGEGLRCWRLNPQASSGETLFLSAEPDRRAVWAGHDLVGLTRTWDTRQVVYSLDRQYAETLDLESGKKLQVFTNHPGIHSVAISPDGQWVATGTRHGNGARLWKASTGELVRQLDPRDSNVSFSPDGRWLAIGFDYEVALWNTRTWQPRPGLPREITSGLAGKVAFSPDSRWLAMSRNEKLLQLVDVARNEPVARFPAPDPQNIHTLDFSRDGGWLAAWAGSEIQLWNLARLRQQLAAWGLEWDSPSPPPPGVGIRRAPRSDLVWLGPLTGCGVVAALGFGLAVWRRHRQWLGDYTAVERMVVERTQALAMAQQEVLQSQKMKALGTLATGIAHDFNNLLSVIRMANKSIARQNSRDLQEDTTDIEEAVLEGKNLVRSMLGYSRGKTGPAELYAVAEVAEETVSLLSKQFLSGLELTLKFDPQAPPVRGSRTRLKQTLLNLVVNASEAMEGHGRLQLTTRTVPQPDHPQWILPPQLAARYLELSVIDSGPGVAPDMLSRIFEPFFTTKTVGGARGTGLGLYLVYASAQAEGFGLAVESEVGAGTAFHLVMPLGLGDAFDGQPEGPARPITDPVG